MDILTKLYGPFFDVNMPGVFNFLANGSIAAATIPNFIKSPPKANVMMINETEKYDVDNDPSLFDLFNWLFSTRTCQQSSRYDTGQRNDQYFRATFHDQLVG